MKNLRYFAIAAAAMLFSSCDDEDGFYNETYIDLANLVQIEAEPSYSVGDYLTVRTDFSRFQPEPGFETPLDIYETTSGAPGFLFSYMLEKETSPGVWQPLELTGAQVEVFDGSVQLASYILATAAYDASDETYEYNAGILLSSTGNYRLSFGLNSDSTNKIELRSRTQGNNLFLNINSTTTQLNGQGYYTFTVN